LNIFSFFELVCCIFLQDFYMMRFFEAVTPSLFFFGTLGEKENLVLIFTNDQSNRFMIVHSDCS
jgi:hypothetical protein